jgi:hypothetical protein
MRDRILLELRFDSFAGNFVHTYWETVKAGTFAMPPNEPVDESVDELLARVSHTTELQNLARKRGPVYRLRMTNTCGNWWLFSFRHGKSGWELIAASARSNDKRRPHNLLGPVYARWFHPFLTQVTEQATRRQRR